MKQGTLSWNAWLAGFATVCLCLFYGLGHVLAADTEFSAEERAWIEANPSIRVHNETDWPPFNFAIDGVPQGYSIDYMNLLGERTGLKVEYITGPTWDEFLDMMREGTLDVMLNIVKTPDRQKYLLYTPPYADNPNTILSRKEDGYASLEQLSGKIVSVPKGFFYEEVLSREFPDIKLHLVKGTLETIKAVSFGKADAAVGELAVFNHLLEQHSMTGLAVSGEVKMGDPELSLLNIATRKDQPVLISILRKGVASISPEEKNEIRNKWVSVHHGLGIDIMRVLQVGGAVGVVLIIVIAWNWRLSHEVTQRKQVESQIRLVLDNFPGGVRHVDKDRNLLFFNTQYQSLFGLPDNIPRIGGSVYVEHSFLWDRGDYGEGDKEAFIKAKMYQLPFETEPQHYETTTGAGRILECFTEPT